MQCLAQDDPLNGADECKIIIKEENFLSRDSFTIKEEVLDDVEIKLEDSPIDTLHIKEEPPFGVQDEIEESHGDCNGEKENWVIHHIQKLLETHERILNERPFACKLCRMSFNTPRDLSAHVYEHKSCKPEKLHPSSKSLISHMETNDRVKPYLCEECGATFYDEATRLHHRKKPHSVSCKLCRKTFTGKIHYKDHLSKVHSPKSHTRSEEPTKGLKNAFDPLTRVTGLQSQQYNEIQIETTKYPCLECELEFYEYREMLRHRKAFHTYSFICTECRRCFKLFRELQEHKKIDCI